MPSKGFSSPVILVLLMASLSLNAWQYLQHTRPAPSGERISPKPTIDKQKPRVYLSESALIWLQTENYALAIAAMDQLAENSSWQAAELQLAWSQELTDRLNNNETDFVERTLDALLAAYPYHQDYLFTQALLFERQNKWFDASEIYFQLSEQTEGQESDNFARTAQYLASVAVKTLLDAKNYSQAIQLLDNLLWREPENTDLLGQLISVYLAQGNVEQAELYIDRLQQIPGSEAQVAQLQSEIRSSLEPEATQLALRKFNRHLLVPVAVNSAELQLLLDTGASLSVIDNRALSRIPNPQYLRSAQMNTAGGRVVAQIYRADRFILGPYTLHNIELAVLDLGDLSADGLLGMNVLQSFNFAIDTQSGTLSLKPKS